MASLPKYDEDEFGRRTCLKGPKYPNNGYSEFLHQEPCIWFWVDTLFLGPGTNWDDGNEVSNSGYSFRFTVSPLANRFGMLHMRTIHIVQLETDTESLLATSERHGFI